MDVASCDVTTSETSVSKQIAFNTTPRMSIYLICFVIGDFEYIENNRLKFPVRVYAVRGAKIQHASSMLDVAVQALDLYHDMFGIAYPLLKLDLVAFPKAADSKTGGASYSASASSCSTPRPPRLHFVVGDPDPEAMVYYQGALDLDSTRASHPIYNPDASPDQMSSMFDNITYMKGVCGGTCHT